MNSKILSIISALFLVSGIGAQTETDGLMMAKNNLCGGIVLGSNNWNHYWEGTYYRNNQNIGTLQTKVAMGMLNYGVSDKFNIIALEQFPHQPRITLLITCRSLLACTARLQAED